LRFSLYIAKRYLKTSSKNNAINIINIIASLGIVVGAMALFVVLSVFSGLKDFSLSFSNDFDPDLKIFPKYGKSFTISKDQEKKLKDDKNVLFFSKILEEKVLFTYNNKEQVANIKGVDNRYTLVNDVNKTVQAGQWLLPNTPYVVVGSIISQKLSLGLFDMSNGLEIFVPKPGSGAINNPESAFNKSMLIPTGIYSLNDEIDAKYVFADLKLTQELLEYKKNEINGIEIKLSENADVNETIPILNELFKNQIIIKNRAQLNDSLYKMLNTENIAVYLIFTLVIIIALFNLIGALIMMILDKKDNLKTLYKIGTPLNYLKNIFLIQGTLLSFFGGLLGLFLGTILVLIQQYFSVVMITDTLSYPVIFSFQNLTVVFLTILLLGFIASLIASSRVSKKLLEE
jgi:lipoprotein-releasing system permease protein